MYNSGDTHATASRSSLATRTIATAPARAKIFIRALTTTNLRTSLVKIKADNVLVGQWVETDSSERCTTRHQGSHYWGRIQFRFDEGADAWNGNWS